jgi:DNA invertase Pin-like site-specific DNA recombinase
MRVAEFLHNEITASGRKPRPGFLSLLAAITDGQDDVVVVCYLSCLTRNALHSFACE